MGCLDDLFLPSPSLSGLTSAEKQLIHLNAPRPKREVRKVTWAELEGLQWLAEGGSCDVWSAYLLGEPVAVKVIKQGLNRSEEARCSLAREAELLPLLSHRNILQLIGKGESEDGRPFLVLELLASVLADELPRPCVSMCGEPNEPDECTLCEFWRSARRWPLRRALLCGLQLAQALRYLHEEPIAGERVLHRDLKPENVGFLPDGTLILLDFGLASRWRLDQGGAEGGAERRDNAGDDAAAAEAPPFTSHDLIRSPLISFAPADAPSPAPLCEGDAPRPLTGETGTRRYMSPEVALALPYSSKAEVFSFATLLWQLASHQRPFRGLDEAAFVERVARGGERPPPIPGAPAELSSLLADCWAEEESRRPSFRAVVERLRGLLMGADGLCSSDVATSLCDDVATSLGLLPRVLPREELPMEVATDALVPPFSMRATEEAGRRAGQLAKQPQVSGVTTPSESASVSSDEHLLSQDSTRGGRG